MNYKILVGECQRDIRRWEDNIKTNLSWSRNSLFLRNAKVLYRQMQEVNITIKMGHTFPLAPTVFRLALGPSQKPIHRVTGAPSRA